MQTVDWTRPKDLLHCRTIFYHQCNTTTEFLKVLTSGSSHELFHFQASAPSFSSWKAVSTAPAACRWSFMYMYMYIRSCGVGTASQQVAQGLAFVMLLLWKSSALHCSCLQSLASENSNTHLCWPNDSHSQTAYQFRPSPGRSSLYPLSRRFSTFLEFVILVLASKLTANWNLAVDDAAVPAETRESEHWSNTPTQALHCSS